jgi:hypothetical protein
MVALPLGAVVRPLLVAFIVVQASPNLAIAHPGGHGAASSGPMSHSGAGIVTLRPDEDLKLAVDFFGYVSGSAASGWRSGEPLGPGGKIPLFYNNYLPREFPLERAGLAKKDYWPQYRDFSYNPLWQPSQLGVRTQYRFIPTLRATVTAVYFGSLDQVTADPNPIEIEELFVRWTPESIAGLSVSAGHLLLVGSYAAPFDQFPLEGFQFNGAAVAYERPAGTTVLRGQLAGGRTPLGRTTALEPINPELPFHPPFLDGLRERNHVYGTAGARLRGGLSFGLVGGYQVLPADQSSSTETVPNTRKWPRSSGWHAGAEVGFDLGGFGQHLSVAHGWGDVEMAWGAPDYVYIADPVLMYDRFTRQGSTLLQAAYWGYLSTRRFQVLAGAWGQWRRPSKVERISTVFNEVTEQLEDISSRTQDFRAAKMTLEPAVNLGPASFGVRLDGIVYLDKKATTDTVEPQVDSALRRVTALSPTGTPVAVPGPSLWEREAVDSLIVSPFVDLRLGEIVRVRTSWSGAWYSAAIHRQREASDFHANVTVSVWLVYRFGVDVAASAPGSG